MITIEQESKEVFTLLMDEEPIRSFHSKIFGKRPKFHSTTPEELEEEFTLLEKRRAKVFVLSCLAKKSYHSNQLRKLLEERLISDSVVEEIIDECEQLGYLNDDEWIKRSIEKMRARKIGPRNIFWKLKSCGVKEEAIEPHLQGEDQGEQIQKLLKTRYRSKDLSEQKERNKVISALLRRGFDLEAIKSHLIELQ